MKKNIIDDISLMMMSKTNNVFDVPDGKIINIIRAIDNLNMPGCDGRTLLMHASAYNRVEIVKYLLEKGADLCLKDKSGFSALQGTQGTVLCVDNPSNVAHRGRFSVLTD